LGLEAEAGGSAFSRALKQMETAVATGSDSLDDFAKVAGLTRQEFASLWRSNPADAFQAFIVGLSRMDDEGISAIATLDEIGISEIRLSDTLLRSANATQVLADAQAIYRQELQYNSEEYLRENLSGCVRIYGIKPSVAESTSDSDLTGYSEIMSYVKENDFSRKLTTFVMNMDISVMEYDEIYDMLATEVTDCYMNELVYLEDKVPQEYLARWYHEKFNDD